MSEEIYDGITLESRAALWAVLTAITSAILLIFAINFRHFKELFRATGEGRKELDVPDLLHGL